MAENEQIEQAVPEKAEAFHVNLEPNGDSRTYVASDSEEAPEPEVAEPAEEAQAESAEETEETFLSEDDEEIDLTDPAYKAAYARLLKSYTKKVQKLQKAPEETPTKAPEPEQPTETAEADGQEWDPYTVKLDSFEYQGEPEPEDSGISGFEAEIDRRATGVAKKIVGHVLQQMRENDKILQQRHETETAHERITRYANAISDHPEYESKKAELLQFATDTRELARKNPDRWIQIASAQFGMKEDWQEEALSAASQESQSNQKLAAKPRSSVARPSRASRPALAAVPSGTMSMDEAFEQAWSKRR